MVLEECLNLLQSPRKSGKGWIAYCPSHPDKTPSLSIKEGVKGLLLKCWAGCQLRDICSALNLTVSDLFYDQNMSPGIIRRHRVERRCEKAKSEVERMVTGFQIDAVREAERYLKTMIGTDISTLNDRQLSKLLGSIFDALKLIQNEEREIYVNH